MVITPMLKTAKYLSICVQLGICVKIYDSRDDKTDLNNWE